MYLKIVSLFSVIFAILIFVSWSQKEKSTPISIDINQGKAYYAS